ncbi:hypothetical protein BJY00DRAFT_303154 [Aspergillus carlsbadensis]|nr:hypothetical protein BJY00DRAFT_303154 [Aspergillus carlsbadensis]
MSRPRKPHKKSKYGCDNCRRRRVKCDERGPPCTNCVVRQIPDCTYSRVLPASLIVQAQAHACACRAGHDASTQLSLPSSASLKADAVDELELMHHFATETYQTLCVLVPRLALKHRYLMHGILSLASLHIATTREGSEARVLSLEPFRIAIGDLSPENCEAPFAQSILAAYKTAAASEPTPSTRMTDHILTVFKLLQGVKRILTLNKQHITLPLFTQGPFWRKDISTTLDPSTNIAFDRLARLNQSASESNPEPSTSSPEQSLITAGVITYLRHCFMKFACAPAADPAPVLAWLGAVDLGFVESLRRRERVPLLVLAFWGVLLMQLDGERWWARGAGRALVDEVMGVLEGLRGSTSMEWGECLGWVRGRMGGEVVGQVG